METRQLLIDSWNPTEVDPDTSLVHISESKKEDNESVVDGVNILGRAKGIFFLVDEASRNGRHYSKKLWENVIGKTQLKVDNGQMLGTIGHDQPLEDKDLLEGKVSHRVSKLWIEEGKGFGEILILNTPAGRNLNGLLRGGVKIPVSSRGFGEYKGKDSKGVPMINEETFELECFDFVRTPGVEQAVPELVESVDDDNPSSNNINEEPDNMGDRTEILEAVTAEKVKLQSQLDEALKSLESAGKDTEYNGRKLKEVTEELDAFQKLGSVDDIKDLSKSIVKLQQTQESSSSKLNDENTALNEELFSLTEKIKAYEDLGTVEEVAKVLEISETYLELGSVESIVAMKESIEGYTDLGSVEEIQEVFSKTDTFLESYGDIGSPTAINEVYDKTEDLIVMLKEYQELGSIEEIDQLTDVVEEYIEIGTPAEMDEIIGITESIIDEKIAAKELAESEELSEKYNLPVEKIQILSAKFEDKEELETFLEGFAAPEEKKEEKESIEEGAQASDAEDDKESEDLGRYSMRESRTIEEDNNDSRKAHEQSIIDQPRVSRIMEQLSR